MVGDSREPESGRSSSCYDVESFPDRLRYAINGRPMRSFARDAGVSETVLRKYLSGESTPNLERLVAIASTAGVPVAWLATGEEVQAGLATPEYSAPEPDAIERFKASEAAYLKALKAIEWEPPVLVREGIRTAMYAHGLSLEGAIYLLDMVRRQAEHDGDA